MKNSQKIGSYNIKEGETIEMTTALLGGMKRDESIPCSITQERKAKRKASEASTEISKVEEDKNAPKDPKGRMERVTQRMQETMASVNYRMNDMSSMEQTIASMSYWMSGMTSMINANFAKIDSKFDKTSEAFTHMKTENKVRDQKIGKKDPEPWKQGSIPLKKKKKTQREAKRHGMTKK